MKWEWPGKSAKASPSVSSPPRDQPVVLVPAPKQESLEVNCEEIAVWEQVNELAEVCLKVNCKMVITMQNLMDAMGCLGVGSSTCSRAGFLWAWIGLVSVKGPALWTRGKGRWWRRGTLRMGTGQMMVVGGTRERGRVSRGEDDGNGPAIEYLV